MRDGEARLVERLVAVEEQVEVDRPRPEARALAGPAERALDLQEGVQELPRRERRVERRPPRSGTAAGRGSRPGRSPGTSRPRPPRFPPLRPAPREPRGAHPRGRRGSRRDRRRRAASRDVNRPWLPCGLGSRRPRRQRACAGPHALGARGPGGLAAARHARSALDRRLRADARAARARLARRGGRHARLAVPEDLGAPHARCPASPPRAARARAWCRRSSPTCRSSSLRATVDPLVEHEYWRPLVGADAATPPGPGKPITVIDTGLDLTHEEFAGRPNTIPLGPQNLTESIEDFHGTAVSSVAAAPENGVGVVGVYPQAVLRSIDVGGLAVANVIAALNTAITAGPERDQHELRRPVHAPARGHAAEGVRHGLDPRRVVGERAQGRRRRGSSRQPAPRAHRGRDRPAERPRRLLHAVARRRPRSPWSRHPCRDSALLQLERLRRAFRNELLGAARLGRDRLGLDGPTDAGQHADLRAHARDRDRRRAARASTATPASAC